MAAYLRSHISVLMGEMRAIGFVVFVVIITRLAPMTPTELTRRTFLISPALLLSYRSSFGLWLVAIFQPHPGHTLAQAAFLDEILFLPFELLIQQIIRLMNQTDGDVRHHFGRAGFAKFTKDIKGQRRLLGELAHVKRFFGILVPLAQITHAT